MTTVIEIPTPESEYTLYIPRPLWKDAISEFIGTTLFVYISLAGVNQAILTNQSQLHIAQCFALGLTSGIIVANKSGGHLNPAVSVITYITNQEFGLTRLISYIAAQMCGGFVGGLLVLSVYYSWINNFDDKDTLFAGAFGTGKETNNSLFASILDQFYGSALLMFGIVMIPDSSVKPLAIGTVLGALGLFQGTNGFAFNLARDLGPRIASSIVLGATPFTFANYWFWVPMIIPFFGVAFGCMMAKLIKKLD
jgi:aquaglyceroporin related protein